MKKHFTMIEVGIVLLMLTILSLIFLPALFSTRDKIRKVQVEEVKRQKENAKTVRVILLNKDNTIFREVLTKRSAIKLYTERVGLSIVTEEGAIAWDGSYEIKKEE